MHETRYARSGDVNIAYQVVGRSGGLDLLLVPGWVSHLEHAWEQPRLAAFLGRLASFSRLILMDRRGTGLSDRVAAPPTLEERMDDVRAVMDAAGSERAALMGISEGGPMCSLFAATHPERTVALVLCNSLARGLAGPDYPWGASPQQLEGFLDRLEREWGTGFTVRVFAPSLLADEAEIRSWGRFERHAVSPGGARALLALLFDTDVTDVLPSIRVPSLVVHRAGDRATPVGGGRYMAERIPGARFVEVEGIDHFPWVGDSDAILDEIEEFLTGVRRGAEPDRILATVMFSDVVDSTRRAAELGDQGWRSLLERYHELMRSQVQAFQGLEVDTAGDGFFARFDGPARAIRCACSVRSAVARLGIQVRIGLHTGECELMGEKLGGIAVHLGARVASQAGPDEVLVSSTVKDLVAGSGLRFSDRGRHDLKGIPGSWQLFAAEA